MYQITIESLYDAYFDTNRSTKDMIPFSLRIDEEIYKLWQELRCGTYEISRTKAFMVLSPKKREIFAMQPRDKIVNHWVRLRIEPLLETTYSNGCYSCRKGKGGTAFAQDAQAKMQEIINQYGNCYVAHLDLRNFFMSIKRELALRKTLEVVEMKYNGKDKDLLIFLLEKILLYAPEKDFYICGNPEDWNGYPKEKSLITNNPDEGLMMGSVNSQLVANLILTATDKYIESLGISILRYVDDILLMHGDKDYLLRSISKVEQYIKDDTGMSLHKDKRYFQEANKGVQIIGYVIRPDRLYIANRCVGNLHKKIYAYNQLIRRKPKTAYKARQRFLACINSYLGRIRGCRSYKIRRKAWENISDSWKSMIYAVNLSKIVLYKPYKTQFTMPVRKVQGGYQWGKSGKVYPTKAQAEKQGRAIYASGYKGKPKKK